MRRGAAKVGDLGIINRDNLTDDAARITMSSSFNTSMDQSVVIGVGKIDDGGDGGDRKMDLSIDPSSRAAREAASRYRSFIQWETASFYTYEAEIDGEPLPDGISSAEYTSEFTEVSLGMTRLGSAIGTASVSYRSFDMSARAGANYVEVPPTTVEFQDGETHKEIIVRVIPLEDFNGTLEFGLFIDRATAKGAGVGKYLHTTTVKIIDQSYFPRNRLGPFVKGGDRDRIKQIHPAVLVLDFLRMCWTVPVVRKGSIKVMLAHQYHNVVMIMNIFILYFVVKTLSKPLGVNAEKRKGYMLVYGFLWIVPFAGKHYLDYRKSFWKVGGGLRKHLQTLLLKKFLNYNDKSRSEVAVEEVVMAMVRDVVDAVSEAYVVAIDLVCGSLVKLVLLIAAMIALQANVFQSEIEASNVVPPIVAILVLPVFIVVFLKVRAHKGFDLRQTQFDAENGIVEYVIKTVINYQLVHDYDRRTFQTASYERFINTYNKASVAYVAFTVNSKYFVPWLTTVLVAGWIAWGGSEVVNNNIQLATFLSTITIFRSAGAEFEKAYVLQLRMTSAYASIAQITTYLNLPVDVPMRRIFGRKRRAFGLELRNAEREKATALEAAAGQLEEGDSAARARRAADEVAVDRLPIRLERSNFNYDGVLVAKGLADVNIDFTQGRLVAMKGPPGEGKATVLRLLANAVFPVNVDEALVFTPPHLRVVQVQENPKILGGLGESVFTNMTYGIKQSPSTDWAALEKRSRDILVRLGASSEMMAIFKIKDQDKLGTSGMKLTRADQQVLNLGRAFLMNPEMIIAHKPTALLDNTRQEKAIALMQEYVRNRGVLMDPNEPLIMRRKRTLIFTTLSDQVAALADDIYVVEGGRLTKV